MNIDWGERALASEIEFSCALGAELVNYPGFIHLYNRRVPWAGDFNRAVAVRFSDLASFQRLVRQVQEIHRQKSLESPNRYDIYPPPLDEVAWGAALAAAGFRLQTAIFLSSPAAAGDLPAGFQLYSPTPDEYLDWFWGQQKAAPYYTDEWFDRLRPLRLGFIEVFQPYWLLQEGLRVGWVYTACLDGYLRLFEVEIEETRRGQGLGRLLLRAIRVQTQRLGAEHVLLQATRESREFYEKAGFQECSCNSILWRR